MAGDVAGVGRNLVGDNTLLDVLGVGQPQVLLRSHVAQERRPVVGGSRGPDGRGDVVVAGGDVGHQRPEHVKGRLLADLLLNLDVVLDLVERDVARPLHHDLHVGVPAALDELPQDPKLGELGCVGRVSQAARPKRVAKRDGHVVGLENLQNLVEVGIEWVFLFMGDHPVGHETSAAGDDARDAAADERQVLAEDAAVDGHVVHPLDGLRLDYLEDALRRHLWRIPAHVGDGLVQRHGADGNGRRVDQDLADARNIPTR